MFTLGPDKNIHLTMSCPLSVGCNVAEIMRALDAILVTDEAPLVTLANWVPDQDV